MPHHKNPQTDLPLTEQRNPASASIDELETVEVCRLINRQDAQTPLAVAEALDEIALAVDVMAHAFLARTTASFTWAQVLADGWACWMLLSFCLPLG